MVSFRFSFLTLLISLLTFNFSYAQKIDGGTRHVVTFCGDSIAYAWGKNQHGQLGNSGISGSSTPVSVNNLDNVVWVDAGSNHSVFLLADSTVWTCGFNSYGQLGDGTSNNRSVPVPVSQMDKVVAIAAGTGHTLYVKADSSVWVNGLNSTGQFGNGTNTGSNVPIQLNTIDSVWKVAAGYGHSHFLKYDSTVYSSGYNTWGQMCDGTTTSRNAPVKAIGLSGITEMATGYGHSLFLKSDSTVWASGRNDFGQLGDGTTTHRSTPFKIPGLSGVVGIATGDYHSLFLKADGTVWGCGRNHKGQLGLGGTSVTQKSIAQATSLSNIIAIGAGTWHSMFVAKDGSIWACGDNSEGELGDGTTTDRATPVQAGLNCCFPDYVSQDTTVCQGDSVQVGSYTHFQAGVYTDTLFNAFNCDSIVTTTLSVNPSYHDSTSITICQGDSVVVGAHTYFQSGIYTDTLRSVHFCDSIIITNLQVNPTYQDTSHLTITYGDSVQVGDSIYTKTGIYTDTLSSAAGCDSIVITNLMVLSGMDITETAFGAVHLFPNPFSSVLHIQLENALNNGRLTLYNTLGQTVRKEEGLNGQSFNLYRGELKRGLYYLNLSENQVPVLTKAVRIQD
ncbi:MAG: T9SS type A sorting domain-containing protein [Owenweeksia sp.]